MNRACLALLMMCVSLDAWPLGRLADVEILNRDTGETLPVYRYHGEYWIAGKPGSRYAVVINNLSSERLLAVTSVDGVNVISGETAAWNQTGYVFQGGQSYSIDGWRKSNQEVADFNFTAVPDSYAARTGRAGNVGVIGVAMFLERPPPAPVVQYQPDFYEAPSSAAERAADSATRATAAGARTGALKGAARSPAPQLPAPQLGTGHGAREASYVRDTEFERLSDRPNEIIRIRYDRYDNLVAMGIVRARPEPATPNAFPDSGTSRFVPDPPGGM